MTVRAAERRKLKSDLQSQEPAFPRSCGHIRRYTYSQKDNDRFLKRDGAVKKGLKNPDLHSPSGIFPGNEYGRRASPVPAGASSRHPCPSCRENARRFDASRFQCSDKSSDPRQRDRDAVTPARGSVILYMSSVALISMMLAR